MNKHGHSIFRKYFPLMGCSLLVIQSTILLAQPNVQLSPSALKKLSVEELMNIEVTSVSKIPEKLTEVASAIQVLTGEDVQRSGATRLPEALRLASNLQVAQSNSHDWAITARGFNGAPLLTNTLSDKLLVMTDGRSVYTPLFGGVFWDAQNVLMEDLDRIEVVSGPGGTLWGANAVNGVINIITKNARETQGLYVTAATGNLLQDQVGLRYGFHTDSSLYFRVYGQRFDQHSTQLQDGSDAQDHWAMTQGGFRMDYFPSAKMTVTVQGDLYGGRENNSPSTAVNGQNVLGRWSRRFSEKSDLSLQVYFDRTFRDLPVLTFKEVLNTYDVDLQYHFPLGRHNAILSGVGYRLMDDSVTNSPRITFSPARKTLQLFNAFIQDQIEIVPRCLVMTLGTKLLHNDYSGFEWQPSARLAWTPNDKHTVWAAVSHAVRTPARLDADETTPSLTTLNGEFDSEKVIAYEIGYRVHPIEKLSVSVATFYHNYDDLRSLNTNPSAPPSFIFANDQQATTWGFELSGNYFIQSWWRLRGGFSYLNKTFSFKNATVLPNSTVLEGIDPQNQVLLQSIMDLPKNFQIDIVGRYVDLLAASPTLTIPSYLTFDLRLAWIFKRLTLSVVGQNLGEKAHREFGLRQIPRSYYVKTALRF